MQNISPASSKSSVFHTEKNSTSSKKTKSASDQSFKFRENELRVDGFFINSSINNNDDDLESDSLFIKSPHHSYTNQLENSDRASKTMLNNSSESNYKIIGKITFSLVNGVLYFMVARAGAESIKSVLHWEGESSDVFLYTVEAFACINRCTFIYKFLEVPTLLPKSLIGGALSALSILSASSFLTAGIVGAKLLSIPNSFAITIGIVEYLLRMVNMIDGSVKFPEKFNEIISAWKYAVQEKDYKEGTRLAITIFMTLGICLGNTDSIYAAITTIGTWFGAGESNELSICSYVGSGLGALGLLPVVFYWGHRGMKQLTFGGRINDKGETIDPTDKYTFLAILPTLPVILGMLGTVGPAATTNGQVFSKLGLAATVVRFSSAVTYTICSGVPGLSTLFRGLSSSSPSISSAFSVCKESVCNTFFNCKKDDVLSEVDPLLN